MIERQKQELLKYGVHDLEDKDDTWDELQEAEKDPVKEEDDSWDDENLTYITAILESFSGHKSNSKPPGTLNYALFPPEGVQTRARQMTPPKFNQNFNQKPMSCKYEERNFSCFSNFEEEGTTELADYFSDKEDNSLDNEDLSSESDSWSQSDFEELEEISDEGHTWSEFGEFEANECQLETINEVSYKETGEQSNIQGISSLSEEIALAFSEWQPYIPPEPAFQNLSAPSWRSAFLQPASLSQEPTLTQISTITGPLTTTKQTQAPRLEITP